MQALLPRGVHKGVPEGGAFGQVPDLREHRRAAHRQPAGRVDGDNAGHGHGPAGVPAGLGDHHRRVLHPGGRAGREPPEPGDGVREDEEAGVLPEHGGGQEGREAHEGGLLEKTRVHCGEVCDVGEG